MEELNKNLLGRSVFCEGALALCWSASGFETTFRADTAILHFVPGYHADQPAYVKVTVDGHAAKYAIVSGGEKILLENLGEGEHTMRLLRITEGEAPIYVDALELVGEDCAILPPPALPKRKIEFFGDSITCGYGDLAAKGISLFRTYEEDVTAAYAYRTAEALGAEIRIEAISGQGVVLNCRGEQGYRIPDFFEHITRKGREQHDFSTWQPDVVVINAGTNDGGGQVPEDVFGEAAGRFLDRVREVYPKAEIVWFYGLMGLRYAKVLDEVIAGKRETDAHMRFVPVRPIYEYEDETGANGHPNEKGQARGADVLTTALKVFMGW